MEVSSPPRITIAVGPSISRPGALLPSANETKRPFREAQVRGDDHARVLVQFGQQVKQQGTAEPWSITTSFQHIRFRRCIVLFEDCSAFTSFTACTLAPSTYFVTRITPRLHQFVTSIVASVASGWSDLAGWASHPRAAPPLFDAHPLQLRIR